MGHTSFSLTLSLVHARSATQTHLLCLYVKDSAIHPPTCLLLELYDQVDVLLQAWVCAWELSHL